MDIETKLKRFSDVVLKEADEIKKQQTTRIDEKYSLNVNDFRRKAEMKYAEMLDETEVTAEQKKQKRIAQKNGEVKKALIQKRLEFIESIFENVKGRLEDFFKTPDYEQYLIDSVEGVKSGSDESAVVAYIMRRDFHLKDSIEKKTGVKVLITDEDFLGGVRISLDKNRLADLTLKRKFEAEKAGFNKLRI